MSFPYPNWERSIYEYFMGKTGGSYDRDTDSLEALREVIDASQGLMYWGTITAVSGDYWSDPSFTIASMAGLGETKFVGWTAFFFWNHLGTGEAPQGEKKVISAYTNAGVFTTDFYSSDPRVGDEVIVINPILINSFDPSAILAAIAAVLAVATATWNVVKPVCVVSDTVQISDDAEVSTNTEYYTIVKTITLTRDLAAVRIKFDLKTSDPAATAYALIDINGTQVGTERTNTTGEYVTFTEDFADLHAGDAIQIVAKISDSDYAAYVRNFELCYDLILSPDSSHLSNLVNSVFVDPDVGVAGTTWPIGTPGYPVNNLTDAKLIATARKTSVIYLNGWLTADADMDDLTIIGHGLPQSETGIDFNGKSIEGASFIGLDVDGIGTGNADFFNCGLIEPSGITGKFHKCYLGGSLTIGGASTLHRCTFGEDSYIDANGHAVEITDAVGYLLLMNHTAVVTSNIYGNGLQLIIDDSCNAGIINIYGDVNVTNNSGGTVVNDYSIQADADAILAAIAAMGQSEHFIVTLASATLRNSNDAEKNTAATDYTKIKEVLLNQDMAGVRVEFDLKTSNVLGTAYAQIYKNGGAIGTEQTDTTGVYMTFSEDLTDFVKGDLIQIYAKISDASYAADVKNMRLYYDILDVLSVANQDP